MMDVVMVVVVMMLVVGGCGGDGVDDGCGYDGSGCVDGVFYIYCLVGRQFNFFIEGYVTI